MRSASAPDVTMREVSVNSKIAFIDPAHFAEVPVFDLLQAAAAGHVGIDQRLIHAIVDRGPAATPDLLRFGLAGHQDDPVNLEEDLIAIFRHLNSPEALPFYIRTIRENPDDVSDELIDGIVPFGAEALDPLLALYEELGEEQGSDVGFLLAALGVRDERILKLLTERLEYDAGDAALALSVYRDPAAKPALEAMLAQIPESEDAIRRELTMAIESSDEPHSDAEVEPEPFDLWELFPETTTPPVEVLSEGELLEMLSSSAVEYRAEAATSFRNRGEFSVPVRNRLLEITRKDPDVTVRASAWEALGEKLDEPAIRDSLKTALNDESRDIKERCGALVGLAGASDDKRVAQQIQAFYDRPETRAKALETMWRSFDSKFAAVFPKHLDDPDPECRRAAIWGTGYLGGEKNAPRLATMFEDEEFRSDALFAYSLVVPGKVTHENVPALFKKINEAANGLSYGEAELVQAALDQRLVMHGLDPYFANSEFDEDEDDEGGDEPKLNPALAHASPTPAALPAGAKVGRNDVCPCGSGKKYKKCHGA